MYSHDHSRAGDVGHACDMAYPRLDLRMLDHTQVQGDERPFVVDEDIPPKKRPGDGEHAMGGLGKAKQLAVGEMPCRTLVLCLLTGPCSDGTKGETGGQWRLWDKRLGYGL